LPTFQANQEKTTLYAKQDTHWNEAGNQLAGEAIWAFINRRLLGQPTVQKEHLPASSSPSNTP
jgi:hypothetical protein